MDALKYHELITVEDYPAQQLQLTCAREFGTPPQAFQSSTQQAPQLNLTCTCVHAKTWTVAHANSHSLRAHSWLLQFYMQQGVRGSGSG